MFVFYFGIIADITPPVALAAFAGAAISGGNPIKTGINASKLGIAAFIIPYMFVLSPAMLGIDATFLDVIHTTLTAIIGMVGVSAAMIGQFVTKAWWIERALLLAGGLLLIDPAGITDIAGIGILAAVRHPCGCCGLPVPAEEKSSQIKNKSSLERGCFLRVRKPFPVGEITVFCFPGI